MLDSFNGTNMSFLLKFLTPEERGTWLNGNYFYLIKEQLYELLAQPSSKDNVIDIRRYRQTLSREEETLTDLASNIINRILAIDDFIPDTETPHTIDQLSQELCAIRENTHLSSETKTIDEIKSFTSIRYGTKLSFFLTHDILTRMIDLLITKHQEFNSMRPRGFRDNQYIYLSFALSKLCNSVSMEAKITKAYLDESDFENNIFEIIKSCASYGFVNVVKAILDDNDWFPHHLEGTLIQIATQFNEKELLLYLLKRFDYTLDSLVSLAIDFRHYELAIELIRMGSYGDHPHPIDYTKVITELDCYPRSCFDEKLPGAVFNLSRKGFNFGRASVESVTHLEAIFSAHGLAFQNACIVDPLEYAAKIGNIDIFQTIYNIQTSNGQDLTKIDFPLLLQTAMNHRHFALAIQLISNGVAPSSYLPLKKVTITKYSNLSGAAPEEQAKLISYFSEDKEHIEYLMRHTIIVTYNKMIVVYNTSKNTQ